VPTAKNVHELLEFNPCSITVLSLSLSLSIYIYISTASVVRVLGYRSGGPGLIPGATREKKEVGLERGPLSLMSTTEELLDRNVATPV
jgi:hypothetical protein